MKPGRNDPCPCGSGKKYKHCCLAGASPAQETPGELTWHRIRRALDSYGVVSRILELLNDQYGPSAISEAWAEFTGWAEEEDELGFDPESPFLPIFMPWFFHCWMPEPPETAIEDTSLHDRVPTSVFLERHERGMDPVVRRYLQACVEAPFGFHEITRCDAGRGFSSREIFTGEEHEVLERSASQTLQVHDICFAQLVRVDGIVMVESCSPVVFPPGRKLELLDFRDEIIAGGHTPPGEILREYDFELREMYLGIAAEILQPRLPELQNTDGEALVPHRLVFDIESAQIAFDALKHLAHGEEDTDLLQSAKRRSSGELQSVEFPWKKPGNAMHRSWNNTVLGHVRIDGKRLTGEVNSAERAAALRQLIEQALGSRTRHKATTIQSIERELAKTATAQGTVMQGAAETEAQELLRAAPELQAHITEALAAHYEDWVSEKIPALGGQTPLEAVRTASGRERVEALVNEIERGSSRMTIPPDPAVFRRLRERLGLAAEPDRSRSEGGSADGLERADGG